LATGKQFVSTVVLVAGDSNSTLEIDDSTDGTGNNIKIRLKALANDSKVISFPEAVSFESGLYVITLTSGASAIVYLK